MLRFSVYLKYLVGMIDGLRLESQTDADSWFASWYFNALRNILWTHGLMGEGVKARLTRILGLLRNISTHCGTYCGLMGWWVEAWKPDWRGFLVCFVVFQRITEHTVDSVKFATDNYRLVGHCCFHPITVSVQNGLISAVFFVSFSDLK